jgi:hypothetical protein
VVHYGDQEDHASERARVDVGSDTYKKLHPSLARRQASPAVARSNDAFSLGSMAVASTRGGKWASSPLWPLAEVKRIGEVRRCGLPVRRKRK